MKDVEQLLVRIPGVTEARVFAKVLVRCEFPMSEETMMELQCAQARIEYETGWKVEMTISAGRRPEPAPLTDNGGHYVIIAPGLGSDEMIRTLKTIPAWTTDSRSSAIWQEEGE